MAAANARSHVLSPSPASTALFKEDRPRRIDRFISFFGDDARGDDVCGEGMLDSLGSESWSGR
ncbi:MAG: hypothetical protein FJ027_06350 [Candidatus Rokubacteria bacterium]|nr:hypothetical protein [Candidatus Rokubacteria bacterium]